MANYHLEITVISRGKGRSLTRAVHYISGKRLRDSYRDETYYRRRDDVPYCWIFQPANAPPEFHDLQSLCDRIEQAERRYDARTAREFKGSLPNELPLREQIRIVSGFIERNFVRHGLCAVAAIHEGKNVENPSKDNPHVHIIVPTRAVGPEGFSKKKDRERDKREYIKIWREEWASAHNRAYERNRLDIRVSHENLESQGELDREPTPHLSRIDWQREQRGERTPAGDRKREIEERNRERALQRQRGRERSQNRSR